MIRSRTSIFSVLSLWIILLASKSAKGIFGGGHAMPGWFKYQISLQRNNEHMCGGAIIGDRHVLTAAHCFLDNSMTRYTGSYSVVANAVDLNQLKGSAVRVDVEKIYVPTDFRPDLAVKRAGFVSTGDIAVVKLKANLGLYRNPSIDKVNLPQRGITYEGSQPVISGYGLNWANANGWGSSNKLRYTTLSVINEIKCREIFESRSVKISPQHLCTVATRQGEGTCGGDSGGPLVHRNVIIGVVSGGIIACGDNSIPEYFTRVTSYLNLIAKAMNDVQSPIVNKFNGKAMADSEAPIIYIPV